MYFTDINNREEAKKYCADVMCKVQRERANDDVIKTDEFLEKFQTALTPPPHIAFFFNIMLKKPCLKVQNLEHKFLD